MAVSAGFIDLLTDAMRGLGPVSVRRMFGGAGLFADGVMFGLVADDVLYLKSDDAGRSAFEAEGLGPFVYSGKGKPVAMSYWRAPERLYDDPDEMAAWGRRAMAVARRAAGRVQQRTGGSRPDKPKRHSPPRAKSR